MLKQLLKEKLCGYEEKVIFENKYDDKRRAVP